MSGTFLSGAAELKSIFTAPLEAVIDADMYLSQKITDFMIRYGFESEESGTAGDKKSDLARLRMVSFSYTEQSGQKKIMSIPVLSLLQIPLLKIKDAEVDMEVKLFSVRQDQGGAPDLINDSDGEDKSSASVFKAYLTPSGKGTTDAMSSNLKIKLRMTESDMPAGMVHLLSLLNELNSIKNHHEENTPSNEQLR